MLFNVPQNELIEKTAEELKKLIHMPSWGPFVKTGVHKQRPPVNVDWWYVRAAAVLRKIYLLGPIGVSKLRTKYGGKKNRGVKPERTFKGSGNIIRKVLQQLEEAKLIKQTVVGKHKGRVITPKGVSLLFSVAKSMAGKIPKKAPKPQSVKEDKKEQPKDEKKEEKKPVIPKEEQLLKAPPAKKEEKEAKTEDKSPKEEVKEEKPKKEDKKEKQTETKVSEVKPEAKPPKKEEKK